MIFYAHLLTIFLYVPVFFLSILILIRTYKSRLDFYIKILHYQLGLASLFLSLAFISAQYQWITHARDEQVSGYESAMWLVFDLNLPLALMAFLGIALHNLGAKNDPVIYDTPACNCYQY